MGLILLAAGALFALLLLINNLLKALTRQEQVSFWDTALAFLAVLISVSALIWNAAQPEPDYALVNFTLVAALLMIFVSAATVIIELFRPQRLRGSRGLLAFFGGIALAISTLTIPLMAVYFELRTESNSDSASPQTPGTSPETTASPDGDDTDQIMQLIQAIRDVLADEIDADEVAIFTQLDAGVPLVRVIEQYSGDIDRIVDRISTLMREAVQNEVESGEINPFQGAILISQMELFVRIAINSNLTEFGGRFDGGPTPTGTQRSFLSLLTLTPVRTPSAEILAQEDTPTTMPTSTPLPSSTMTNTARPTLTPTDPRPTRTRYATRTFTPSPTAITPCLAVVNYNIRLRSAPSAEADTLLVIPYATTIEVYARNSDSTWWQTIYDSQTGWVNGQYLTLSATCALLPEG